MDTMDKKERLSIPRQEMPRQDPKERVRNFSEVALGFSEELALLEAQRCIQCKNKPCIHGCPVEIDIPGFIELVCERKYVEAARLIKESNCLPAICGRVCPQEDQCEKVCTLGKRGDPVGIGRLERFVADYERERDTVTVPPPPLPTGKSVAVVGSGPAGLAAAGDLVKLGHRVTVFEAFHTPGGVLVYGIPEFRLPKDIVKAEVEYLAKLGVEFKVNSVIGKLKTLQDLFDEGYQAIFLGLGAGLPMFMNIPGENSLGVYSANEFLTRVNLMRAYLFPRYDTPIKRGKRVAVVGAGNVAMDAARSALRLGAEEVSIVYRRTRTEMPARKEEIENAREEGIGFQLLTSPVKIEADERGWVRSMICQRMDLGEPDSSGRRRPIPIAGSEFEQPYDIVIMAIGTRANPLLTRATPELALNKWGNITVDDATGKTSMEGVYAGGDIVTGAATVILALGAGRMSARAIDEYLKSKD